MIYLSEWLLPVSEHPIHNGGLVVIDYQIVEVGEQAQLLKKYPDHQIKSFGNAVIAPAWINTHCHLELSALAGKIPVFRDFVDWIRQLINVRSQIEMQELIASAQIAAQKLMRSGCALVGDISNGQFLSADLYQDLFERVVFYEILGVDTVKSEMIFNEADKVREKENIEAMLTPHALYSTSADLIQRIAKSDKILSIHVAESPQESMFIKEGSGPFKDFLIELNAWDSDWKIPGQSPVAYLNEMDVLSEKSLLVHGVQTNKTDFELIKQSGATVCICARSNDLLNVGSAPVNAFIEHDIPLTIGTDSLASNVDLDMNNEIYYIYKNYEQLNPATLVRMSTLNGAKILGKASAYGSLGKGKRARFNVFHSKNKINKEPERFVVSKSWSALECF